MAGLLELVRNVWWNRYMGGDQNYGPFRGPLNTRCRIILRTQKRTIILTTTHMVTIHKDPDQIEETRLRGN